MMIGYGAQCLVDTASWAQILDNKQTFEKYFVPFLLLRLTPHAYCQLGGWVPIQYIGCKQLSIWRVCFCIKILFASWVGLVPIQYIGNKCKQLAIGGVYTEWRVIPVCIQPPHLSTLGCKTQILGTNASN